MGGGAPPVLPFASPFAGAAFYVNPDYAQSVRDAAALDPAESALIEKVAAYSTAIWLDRIARVPDVGRHLDGALAAQERLGRPVVTVFVVYDLPNRDCAANASNGELSVEAGGLARYQSEFIDAIAAQFRAHPNQRIAAIVEPDSLPNLATNLGIPKCAASQSAYREGVAYALSRLSAPNVALYLDAAHAGWLGWPNNRSAIAAIYRQVLDSAGGIDRIRGFATDVANYTVLREVPELFDYQSNPCRDELSYVQALSGDLAAAGIANRNFVIDTSRNGRGGIRHQWGFWCNNLGAGLGERPQADPVAGVDAYLWVKPPGESDGTSDPSSPRFDPFCAMQDAAPGAPEAGLWFQSYFLGLVHQANPPL